MANRLHHVARDERGMSLVFVTVSFMAVLTATTLAIDIGMFMNSRSQAQNSADAGALAGAIALAFNSYTDRSETGPAVQGAINTAKANLVAGGTVSVEPADVTFPNDPNGQPTRVAVQVFRTVERKNSVPTLLGSIFGVDQVDIRAAATAEASPANSMSCVKPFMIPDKWRESSGTWTTASTFDAFDKKGTPVASPDIYFPPESPDYTGYTVKNDVGTELVLRAGVGDQPEPSFYYSWKMPDDTGGSFYRDNIAHCNQSIMTYDPENPTYMIQEPGAMAGPTLQGIQDLIDQDPDAKWDKDCMCVKSKFAQSPRVFPIPLFDPMYYADGKANGRGASFKLRNFLGFYADHIDTNGKIYGIITAIGGTVSDTAGPTPTGMFAKAIRLVQ
jgi:hypothetical protein